jgi:hypothetical protein
MGGRGSAGKSGGGGALRLEPGAKVSSAYPAPPYVIRNGGKPGPMTGTIVKVAPKLVQVQWSALGYPTWEKRDDLKPPRNKRR